MKLVSWVGTFLSFLLHRTQVERDMEEELRSHLERRADDLERQGLSRAEAERQARIEFGGYERYKEECREALGSRLLGELIADIRYGLRGLRRNPGFTAVVAITLALGVGANTAIFSVVDAVLLRPLPYSNPDQLVYLRETNTKGEPYPVSGPDYLDWRAQAHTMAGTTLYSAFADSNASGAGEPEKVEVCRTEANFFSMLGSRPAVGRTFLEGEDQPGRNHVAVLTYSFWQRHFGGARDAVGKDLVLNGEKYTIIGVASASIPSVAGFLDVYIPMDMTPKGLGPRGARQYEVLGRMKPGVSVAQARAEFQTIVSRLAKQYPDSNKDMSGTLIPFRDGFVGSSLSRAPTLILLAVVGLVLLIACANVANLLLVRATGRHQEMAIRNALGAGRGRVARQLLTESLLLSLLGAALAVPLGWAGVRLLAANQTLYFPVVNVINMNFQVLAFTLGVGLLVGILVGLAPALWVSSLQVTQGLKTSAQAVVGSPRGWRLLRDALVVGEIAVALALLVGAGLLLRIFAKLRGVELGISPEGVLTAHIILPPNKYSTLAQRRAFFDQLEQNLRGAHGVRAAAVGLALPLEGGIFQRISVDGRESPGASINFAAGNAVTPDYFRAFGIPFLRGRNFTPQDFEGISESIAEAQGKPVQLVAIINQKMARQFWPDQDPVGRIFNINGTDQATIIGVVGDTRAWPGVPMIPQAYYPLPWGLQPPQTPMSIVVKGTADTGALAATVRQQVHALDDSLALYEVRTMREVFSDSLSWASHGTLLLSIFAVLALALTAVGIYGVMAYAVAQRTHEIGLRMALGARSGEILGLVMRQGTRITIAGVSLGLACAWALTRFLPNILFEIKVHDPATFVLVAALLAAIALVASYIPARRATKLDPMITLRYE